MGSHLPFIYIWWDHPPIRRVHSPIVLDHLPQYIAKLQLFNGDHLVPITLFMMFWVMRGHNQETIPNVHIYVYTTFTNFSMKYLVMCKVYTDVGGIKKLYHVCPPVCKIIHSLKLVDYLHVHADNPWYNYFLKLSMI